MISIAQSSPVSRRVMGRCRVALVFTPPPSPPGPAPPPSSDPQDVGLVGSVSGALAAHLPMTTLPWHGSAARRR